MDRTRTTTVGHDDRATSGSVAALVRDGVLDAELAALLSILVQARVPLVVAGTGDRVTRQSVLDALLVALPPEAHRIDVAGATEDFAWLPEAESLGWRSDGPTPGREPLQAADPATSVIVAGDLAEGTTTGPLAGVIRVAVRACAVGYGLGFSVEAHSLDAVFGGLRRIRLTDDELARLGVVVVLGDVDGMARAIATHYIRPVSRDGHGHVQRLGPAVLATYDPEANRFEHFGWGVIPELAMRVGRKAGDFEATIADRRAAIEEALA